VPPTSPYRTQADLINKVLSNLGVLSAGQPTDPEDYAKVANNVDSYARTLAALEIVYLADLNNIPGAFFLDVADCMAGMSAAEFSMTGQTLADLINKGLGGAGPVAVGAGSAAKSLKQIGRARYTGEVNGGGEFF
jgi:hypothetical protein